MLKNFWNKINVTLLEPKCFSSNYIKFDLLMEEKVPEAIIHWINCWRWKEKKLFQTVVKPFQTC